MADSRVTQFPIQALSGGTPDARLTQLPIQVLGTDVAASRALQFPIQVLAIEVTSARVLQYPVQVLASSVDCISYLVQCWRIQRLDGIIHTFTSHDQQVVYAGETYYPCGSINASAYQASGQFGEVGNATLAGLIALDNTQSGIPARDIAAGLLDAAEVKIWEVPWKGDENVLPVLKGYIGKIEQKDINYQAEIITLSSLLNSSSLLDSYTPNCRFRLGDANCTVDLGPLTESSEVSDLAEGSIRMQSSKRQFFDVLRTEIDGYWANGNLTWDSGDNAGYSSEVANSFDSGAITLWNVMPNDIQIGDEYTIVPGCDLLKTTCISKFNNIANFGGFPDIPGNDVIFQTPDAKQ